jgi:hypothetical protein
MALANHYGHKLAESMILSTGLDYIKDDVDVASAFRFRATDQGSDFWYKIRYELMNVPVAEYWERVCPKLFNSMSNHFGKDRTVELLGGLVPFNDEGDRVSNDKKYPISCFNFVRSVQGSEFWMDINKEMFDASSDLIRSKFPMLLNTLRIVYGERLALTMIDDIGDEVFMEDYPTPSGSFVWESSSQGVSYWDQVQEEIESRYPEVLIES